MSPLKQWLAGDEEAVKPDEIYEQALTMARESLEDRDPENARELYSFLNQNFDLEPDDAKMLYKVALKNTKSDISDERPITAGEIYDLAQEIRYDHGPRKRADDRESARLKD